MTEDGQDYGVGEMIRRGEENRVLKGEFNAIRSGILAIRHGYKPAELLLYRELS